MILAVNIGNTNISVGGYERDGLQFSARLSSDKAATADELAIRLSAVLALEGVRRQSVEGAVMGSVAPALTAPMRQALEKLFGVQVLVVGPGLKSGLPIRIQNPAELGAELLCGAVAALRFQKPPFVLIHMDTACSMMAVDRSGALVGGVITAGPSLALNSLVQHTSRLPQVDLASPEGGVLSTNTAASVQAGAVLGAAAMVDGLMQRFRERLGEDTAAVATGSFPEPVRKACTSGITYKETLILDGLYLIWGRNTKNRERTGV